MWGAWPFCLSVDCVLAVAAGVVFRSRSPRYCRCPSYGQRSYSPRGRSSRRRSVSPRARSYSRSPPPFRAREEVPYTNGERRRSRS